jgi:hypothetical protein
MRASTAFFVGIGTLGLAIAGGLGGGLVIGNMMSQSPPKHAAEAARLERPTQPQPLPSASALPYTAAALAFTDPSIDGSAPPADQRADSSAASPPPVKAATGNQPASEAQQAAPPKQAAAPEDAYAKARYSDVKHPADKRRAERAQRFSDRHRGDQDQSSDQQAGDDRNSYGSDRPSYFSYNHSDHRYRDDRSSRYRDAGRGDDRAPPYYVDEAPRFGFPRIQPFGSDD